MATVFEVNIAGNERQSVRKQIEVLATADQKEHWITDSGASRHITFRREWLTDFQSRSGSTVSLGDDGQSEVLGEGIVLIEKLVSGQWIKVRIESVLYVPSLKKNLFSVGACAAKGFQVSFNEKNVVLVRENSVQAVGYKRDNNIYYMLFRVIVGKHRSEADTSVVSLRECHERLGHINKAALQMQWINNSSTG